VSSKQTLFPGGTSVSRLQVYPWQAPDGLAGGTPHMHTLCTEAYVVISGKGRVQTISRKGFAETMLTPSSVVWFGPGIIHRVINDGDLRVLVIMQNSGLPEAGDAVMTFLPDVLHDADRYAALAQLPDPSSEGTAAVERAAKARQAAAVDGFNRIRQALSQGDQHPLLDLYESAGRLVAPKTDDWRGIWAAGAASAASETGEYLTAMAQGNTRHLGQRPAVARREADGQAFGMCGFLEVYNFDQSHDAGLVNH
jgi:mannose-6-phosphate isomerase-like protein (cupin superfamily)